MNHRQLQLPREQNFKFGLKFLYRLCMRSGGTDGMSRHQYQSQLNTIACCFQAVLRSLIMRGWHCWSHMVTEVWEFNHRTAIKFNLHYSWPPLCRNPHSLACLHHIPEGLGEAGSGKRASTWFTGQQIVALPAPRGRRKLFPSLCFWPHQPLCQMVLPLNIHPFLYLPWPSD